MGENNKYFWFCLSDFVGNCNHRLAQIDTDLFLPRRCEGIRLRQGFGGQALARRWANAKRGAGEK